jgi:Uma2 family endonuclease
MSVYFGSEPEEDFPSIPPDVVVEIVSEEDRYTQILERLAEFHDWGVKHIWLADPGTRTLAVYDRAGLHEVPRFELPEFGATLLRDEMFG